MKLPHLLFVIGFLFIPTGAVAQTGEPLKVNNLQYVPPVKPGGRPYLVRLDAKDAPKDIKIGNKYKLVDIEVRTVTGTGVVHQRNPAAGKGPAKDWLIRVTSVVKK